MTVDRRPWAMRYGIAALSAAAVVLLKFAVNPGPLLMPYTSASVLIAYCAATVVSAWLGGFGPSLFTTLVLAASFLVPLRASADLLTLTYWSPIITFLLLGGIISGFGWVFHAIRQQSVEHQFRLRHLETAQRQLEGRFQFLLQGTKELAFFTLNGQGKIAYWNNRAEQLFGYRSAEVLGQDPAFLYPKEERQLGAPERHVKLASEKGLKAECGFLRKDGSRVWADFAMAAIRTPAGELQGYSCLLLPAPAPKPSDRMSERLGRTLDHSANEIYVFDADTLRFIQVNAGARKNLGYSMDELTRMTPQDLQPELKGPWLAEMLQPLRSGHQQHISYETSQRRKDGSTYPVDVRVQLSRSETPLVFIAIVQNITDRRVAEQERAENLKEQTARAEAEKAEVKFRGLLESAPDAIVVMDGTGNIALINSQTEGMFGYDREELLGQPVELLIPERFREMHLSRRGIYLLDAEQRTRVTTLEVTGRRKNGSEIPLEITLSPFETDDGLLVTSAIRDVTERKRAQEARMQLASIVETSNDAIISMSLEGRILTWNPAAERLYGYSAAEAIGQPVSILVAIDRTDAVMAIIQQIKHGERITHYETRQVRKDGNPIDVSLTFSPIREAGGRVASLSMIARDITERKRNEAALRKAHDQLELRVAQRTAELSQANNDLQAQIAERQRAEEEIKKLNVNLQRRVAELAALNKELEAFSYSVSHDLRQPLRNIDGFSLALLEDYADKLDDQGKEFLRRSRANCQRMAQLIDDLLQLSGLSRSEMHHDAVNLSALADSIAAELRQRDPDRKVDFRIAGGLTSSGDPCLLRLVLENLLDNAWKFTSKRPQAVIEFGLASNNGQSAYFVRDNGAGFDSARADKMFSAFQRLHSPSEFQGTGVGLATVQRIIHRHGGRVWAEGAVDQGATFFFTI